MNDIILTDEKLRLFKDIPGMADKAHVRTMSTELLQRREEARWKDAVKEKPRHGYYEVVFVLEKVEGVGISQLGDDGVWRSNGTPITVRLYREIPLHPDTDKTYKKLEADHDKR